RASAESAREAARVKEDALESILTLEDWPREAVEVASLAGRLFGDRLVVTERAIQSIEKSKFASCDSACGVLWRCLRAIATELHALVMSDCAAQTIADEFRKRTGFELAWTETKHTKRDNKLMAQRKFEYKGRQVDMMPH